MKYLSKPLLGTQLDWSNSLNKGLVGFWLFNEGHGNKVNDLSMNGNVGTLTNMAFPPTAASGWNPGRKGIGLNFNDVNDYVDAGNKACLDITNAITIGAWVKPNKLETAYLVKKASSGLTDGYELSLSLSTNKAFFRVNQFTSSNIYRINSTTSYPINGTWAHLVVVYDGINMKIYFNGAPDGSIAGPASILTNTDNLEIGGPDAAEYFSGSFDEVRIYNRALNAKEIMKLYIDPYGMFL